VSAANAVRAWRCSRVGIAFGAPPSGVFWLDRACGYLVLIVLYVLGLPSLLKILPDPQERGGVIAVLVVGLLRGWWRLFHWIACPARFCVFA